MNVPTSKVALLSSLMILSLSLHSQWQEQQKLQADSPTYPFITNEEDKFGWSVGVDGEMAVIGARDSDVSGTNSGAAFAYSWNGVTWEEDQALMPSDGQAGSSFGESVAISGNLIVVGADGDDENGIFSGAVYIFKNDGNSWTEEVKLTASDGFTGQSFGSYVTISGSTALVAADGDNDNGDSAGAVYVFEELAGVWTEVAKLTASDGAPLDFFGRSVSISGDYTVIGASGDDDNGTLSGSAYIFQKVGGVWTEQVKLTASDGNAIDLFGTSVSIHEGRVLVGATGDDDQGGNAGAVYVFEEDGGLWNEAAKLTASDGAASDSFGALVSLSGNTALIGAFRDDDNGDESGSAYLFDLEVGNWEEVAKLTPSDGAQDDFFGFSICLSGSTAMIGSDMDDDNGDESGSAYLFERIADEWVEVSKLVPTQGTGADYLGFSVSLDGDRALMGATGDDDEGSMTGSAYVFQEIAGVWTEASKLTASDGAEADEFGYSVSLSESTALVGAPGGEEGVPNGAVYVFEEELGIWSEMDKLSASDGSSGDAFGWSVAVDGNIALIGAYGDDDNGSLSGSAYVFERMDGHWTEVAKLTASDGGVGDRFGWAVSLSGTTALVGAYKDDDKGSDAGAGYIFKKLGNTWTEITKITASDGAAGDRFAYAVSMAGNRALLGAYKDDDAGNDTGSAYLFEEVQGEWTELTKLNAADMDKGDRFGYSVAVREGVALVGAYWDDDGGENSGSAYVFEELGGVWTEVTKLTASDGKDEDFFGSAVSLSIGSALVGSYQSDEPSGSDSGSAYIFSEASSCDVNAICTDLDVVEIGFGATDASVNATWTNPHNTSDCEVRGGRIDPSSIGTGSPQFANINNTQVITQTDGSTVLFNIVLYNNPNAPFTIGQTYGYEVRCLCEDGSEYSNWSGITPEATFIVPAPPPTLEEESGEEAERMGETSLSLYPNPNNGEEMMLILTGLNEEEGAVQLELLDMMGRHIQSERISAKGNQISYNMNFKERLPNGIYMVRVSQDTMTLSKRLIIE